MMTNHKPEIIGGVIIFNQQSKNITCNYSFATTNYCFPPLQKCASSQATPMTFPCAVRVRSLWPALMTKKNWIPQMWDIHEFFFWTMNTMRMTFLKIMMRLICIHACNCRMPLTSWASLQRRKSPFTNWLVLCSIMAIWNSSRSSVRSRLSLMALRVGLKTLLNLGQF